MPDSIPEDEPSGPSEARPRNLDFSSLVAEPAQPATTKPSGRQEAEWIENTPQQRLGRQPAEKRDAPERTGRHVIPSPPTNKQRLTLPAKPNVRAGQTLDDDSTGAQAAAQTETRAEPTKTKYMPKESDTSPTKQG